MDKYKDWTPFRNGYAFPLPPGWINSSNIGRHATLEVRDFSVNDLKNIKGLLASILSDKITSGQRFTTPKEFTKWSTIAGEVQGKINKTLHSY